MSDTPDPVATPPPSSSSVELFCPFCGYNLSGTTGQRCSECGEPFDHFRLLEWTTYPNQQLPFGCLGKPTRKSGLLSLSLFSPSELGRLFPPRPEMEAAKAYSRLIKSIACFGLPIFFSFLLAGGTGEMGMMILALFAVLPILLASVACEALVAVLLAKCVEARGVLSVDAYRFWRTLCRCFSGHLLMSAILFCLALGLLYILRNVLLIGFGGPLRFADALLPWLALMGAVLWWWWCLGRAVMARAMPSPGRTLALLLIPVFTLAVIALGVGVGMLEGLLAAACLARFDH